VRQNRDKPLPSWRWRKNYAVGIGVKQNEILARAWYKKAAQKDSADAQYYLARWFECDLLSGAKRQSVT
jgi:TPR repeat protein